MKKAMSVIMVLVFAIAFTACSSNTESQTETTSQNTTTSQPSTQAPATGWRANASGQVRPKAM